MKNRFISGGAALLFGGLTALGPQYIFPLCGHIPDGEYMRCHWSGQAELGVGGLLAVYGVLLFMSRSPVSRVAYSVSAIFAGLLALFIPHFLIGGCAHPLMACRTTTFPALTVISLLTVLFFALNAVYLRYKKKNG
jgi:hypothetical protein